VVEMMTICDEMCRLVLSHDFISQITFSEVEWRIHYVVKHLTYIKVELCAK